MLAAKGCVYPVYDPETCQVVALKTHQALIDMPLLFKLAGYMATVAIVVATAIILVGQMSFIDRNMIYFPQAEVTIVPRDVGLEYDDIDFTASDGTKLHGWYVPGPSRTTLLWFHGNAGNIGNRVDNILMLNQSLGLNVMIFDYRGYGQSTGAPSENGLYLDADAAFEFLVSNRKILPETELILFGRSLGAAVAVEMAVRHQTRAVILESGFPSVRDMIRQIYPFLPARLLLTLVNARYDSISKIESVTTPVMVLHGDQDEIVPFKFGEDLFEAAQEPKVFYRIQGAGHNDTYQVGGNPYFDALREFIRGTESSN